ncbi:DUF6461 domain-containing protein [Embleya sp. AB8]|uniref:DUF6461 domain-containing protein n=1 Tax=Embleya sp. AB8 TaxID=3156304 RepID=UPI003C72DFB6
MTVIHEPPGHDVYAWLGTAADRIHDGTLVFVKGLAADEVLRRLGADPASARLMSRDERYGRPDLLSVHALGGDWLLAFEPNGFDAFVELLLHDLSAGAEVVVFNRNILGHCRFRHIVDGDTWTYFSEFEPDQRYGLHPDRLNDAMRRIGLDPDYDDADDYDEIGAPIGDEDPAHVEHWSAMTMALVEAVTGVRLNPDVLDAPAPTVVRRFP